MVSVSQKARSKLRLKKYISSSNIFLDGLSRLIIVFWRTLIRNNVHTDTASCIKQIYVIWNLFLRIFPMFWSILSCFVCVPTLLNLPSAVGHFGVPPGLCMKTKLGAQPLIWKWFFILMQIKLIFTRNVSYLASFWKWGFLELGNGLFIHESTQENLPEGNGCAL